VKRTVAILAGAAALGLAVFLGSRLVAQQPAQQQPLRTRVGLVNLPHVIKSYNKYLAFEREWNEQYKQFEKQFESKRALLEQYQQQAAKAAANEAEKNKWETAFRTTQREMQDQGEDAKKVLSKKRDDQAVIIYKEIEEAVAAFARANDLELVLTYNDAVASADLNSAGNIQRKLQMGALFPMYHSPNMEITNWIIKMLNDRFGAQAGQPAGQPAANGVVPAAAPAPGRGN
jgi:Skp family chaperone for outer membrane proteins